MTESQVVRKEGKFCSVVLQECLETLMKHCELDLDCKDRWGRTVLEVASKECLVLLQSIGK